MFIYLIGTAFVVSLFLVPMLNSQVDQNARFQTISILPSQWNFSEIIEFIKNFGVRYFRYFLPEFAFGNGDPDASYRMANYSAMPAFLAPFFYLGILVLLKRIFPEKKISFKHWTSIRTIALFILCLLLFAPIPGSLTHGINSSNRNYILFPLIAIVSAIGMAKIARHLPYKIALTSGIVIVFTLMVQFGFFYFDYIETYTLNCNNAFKRSANQLIMDMHKAELASAPESKIYTDNITLWYQPYILYAFDTLYPPEQMQTEMQSRKTPIYIDEENNSIGNIYFVLPEEIISDPDCKKHTTKSGEFYVCK